MAQGIWGKIVALATKAAASSRGSDAETTGQARGILPDIVSEREVVLFKAPRYLRLTYEIRLAAYMAKSRGIQLRISVPTYTRFSPELDAYAAQQGVVLSRKAAS